MCRSVWSVFCDFLVKVFQKRKCGGVWAVTEIAHNVHVLTPTGGDFVVVFWIVMKVLNLSKTNNNKKERNLLVLFENVEDLVVIFIRNCT